MAGAGYKLFNTGDVLTAAQVNTYLMQQTVMVFADASARTTALSGVLAEGMLSYLKSDDKLYKYDGTSWSEVGGASGGMTLISEQTASAATSLSFSSIAGTYKDLMLVWEGIYHSNTTSDFDIRFNNDSGSNYYGTYYYGNPTAYTASTTSGYGSLAFVLGLSSFGTNNNATSTQYSRQVSGTLRINNYASTTKVKHFEATYGCYGSSSNPYYVVASGLYYSTSAVTSLDIVRLSGTGNFTNATNTSIRLYGVS